MSELDLIVARKDGHAMRAPSIFGAQLGGVNRRHGWFWLIGSRSRNEEAQSKVGDVRTRKLYLRRGFTFVEIFSVKTARVTCRVILDLVRNK